MKSLKKDVMLSEAKHLFTHFQTLRCPCFASIPAYEKKPSRDAPRGQALRVTFSEVSFYLKKKS